jgi:hypothetical protein
MPNTYEIISSTVVGSGGAANIEFTSIPQTYTDLLLVCSLRMTEAGTNNWGTLKFNSIGGTSNNSRYFRGNSINTASATGNSTDVMRATIANGATSVANAFSTNSIYIPNYTSSLNKVSSSDAVMVDSVAENYMFFGANLVTTSSAITSIQLAPWSGTWVQHTSAHLYGIKNS